MAQLIDLCMERQILELKCVWNRYRHRNGMERMLVMIVLSYIVRQQYNLPNYPFVHVRGG